MSGLKIMSMSDLNAMTVQVDIGGYAIQEGVLTEPVISELIDALERHQDGERLHRNGRVFAVRNLLDLLEIRNLAESARVRELAEEVL
jgi:hypothetical protein